MIKIKRDFEKIIERHKKYVKLESIDKPLLCIFTLGTDNLAEYRETFKAIPKDRDLEPEDIMLDGYIKDVEDYIMRHEEVGEDFIYPIAPYMTFVPWMEAIIGCPIYPIKYSI